MNKTLRISLLSLLALISSTMHAADTTIDFTKQSITVTDGGFTLAVDPFTFTAEKLTGANKPTQNSTTLDIRIYAAGSLTVSSTANMSKIVFVISTAGKKRLTDITPSTGSVAIDATKWTVTWTGSAQSVTFTVGATATYGTDEPTKAGQFDIDQSTITTDGSGVVKKSADLAFSGDAKIKVEQGTAFTSPAFTKATSAPVTFASDNEAVATVNTDGVITLAGGKGTANITASSVENTDYNAGTASVAVTVFAYKLYTKATTLTSGKPYLFVAQRNDSTFYAYPVASNKTYGYLQGGGISGKVDQIKVEDTYNDEFTITSSGNGYTIVDGQNRYVYHKAGTYNTFNVSATAPADVWTVEPQTDGTFKFSYPDGYYIQFGDQLFSSFGVYNEAKALGSLPMLYEYNENATTGISTVSPTNGTLNQNASLYNLAGQRVDNNYKGIVIQNGKKIIKK